MERPSFFFEWSHPQETPNGFSLSADDQPNRMGGILGRLHETAQPSSYLENVLAESVSLMRTYQSGPRCELDASLQLSFIDVPEHNLPST